MHSSVGSESAASDGWTMVERRHTESRSPEYNDANESSPQVASMSSPSYNGDLASENAQGDNVAGTFELPHRGRSHGCSTETASSDQTFFVDKVTNHQEAVAVGPPLTASQSLPKGPALTERALRELREVMGQSYAGNMEGWIDGTPFVGPRPRPSVSENPPTTKPPKSKHSICSNDGSEFAYLSSSLELANVLVGSGGWCGEPDGKQPRRVSTFDLLEDPMPSSD